MTACNAVTVMCSMIILNAGCLLGHLHLVHLPSVEPKPNEYNIYMQEIDCMLFN